MESTKLIHKIMEKTCSSSEQENTGCKKEIVGELGHHLRPLLKVFEVTFSVIFSHIRLQSLIALNSCVNRKQLMQQTLSLLIAYISGQNLFNLWVREAPTYSCCDFVFWRKCQHQLISSMQLISIAKGSRVV